MPSAETVKLYDKDDQFIDTMTLPAGFGEDDEVRSVIYMGRKFVEGGADSFYGRGVFAEVSE